MSATVSIPFRGQEQTYMQLTRAEFTELAVFQSPFGARSLYEHIILLASNPHRKLYRITGRMSNKITPSLSEATT